MQHRHVTESWDIDFHVYGLNENQSGSRSPKVLKNALSMPGIFIVGEAIAAVTESSDQRGLYSKNRLYPWTV